MHGVGRLGGLACVSVRHANVPVNFPASLLQSQRVSHTDHLVPGGGVSGRASTNPLCFEPKIPTRSRRKRAAKTLLIKSHRVEEEQRTRSVLILVFVMLTYRWLPQLAAKRIRVRWPACPLRARVAAHHVPRDGLSHSGLRGIAWRAASSSACKSSSS